MKKLFTLGLAVMAVLAFGMLGTVQAAPIIYNDPPPDIRVYQAKTGPDQPATYNNQAWVDVLQLSTTNPDDHRLFQTYGMKLVGNKLYIYTEWGDGQGNGAMNSYQISTNPQVIIYAADLFFDLNPQTSDPSKWTDGSWDLAVRLRSTTGSATTGDGTVYTGLNASYIQTSIEFMDPTGINGPLYGGKFDNSTQGNHSAEADVPVQVVGVPSTKKIPVTWTYGTYIDPLGTGNLTGVWEIVVDLTDVPGLVDSNFLVGWGTGLCGNDMVLLYAPQGSIVPLPGALLLLGAGLARLVAYRRRTRVVA